MLGSSPGVLESVVGDSWAICISNEFPGSVVTVWGHHFEKQCFKLKERLEQKTGVSNVRIKSVYNATLDMRRHLQLEKSPEKSSVFSAFLKRHTAHTESALVMSATDMLPVDFSLNLLRFILPYLSPMCYVSQRSA